MVNTPSNSAPIYGETPRTTTLSVNKRLSHGLAFSGNYTYSHAIDDGSSWQNGPTSVNGAAAGDADTTDHTKPDLDRGNSVFDIRHRLTFNYIWEIPFFANHKNFAGALLRGWQLNGIWSFQTGAHWSPFDPDSPLLQPLNGYPGACQAATFDPTHCINNGGDYNLDGESTAQPPIWSKVGLLKRLSGKWAASPMDDTNSRKGLSRVLTS